MNSHRFNMLLRHVRWIHQSDSLVLSRRQHGNFRLAYLSNMEVQNRGDMSEFLTRPVKRTKPVLGAFFKWIGTGGTSFFLGGRWRKGGRTVTYDGGKRTLPQIQIPIWLSWPSHSQSQQRSTTAHVKKLIGTICAAKKVLTSKIFGY